jgi:hypothetical protein
MHMSAASVEPRDVLGQHICLPGEGLVRVLQERTTMVDSKDQASALTDAYIIAQCRYCKELVDLGAYPCPSTG